MCLFDTLYYIVVFVCSYIHRRVHSFFAAMKNLPAKVLYHGFCEVKRYFVNLTGESFTPVKSAFPPVPQYH